MKLRLFGIVSLVTILSVVFVGDGFAGMIPTAPLVKKCQEKYKNIENISRREKKINKCIEKEKEKVKNSFSDADDMLLRDSDKSGRKYGWVKSEEETIKEYKSGEKRKTKQFVLSIDDGDDEDGIDISRKYVDVDAVGTIEKEYDKDGNLKKRTSVALDGEKNKVWKYNEDGELKSEKWKGDAKKSQKALYKTCLNDTEFLNVKTEEEKAVLSACQEDMNSKKCNRKAKRAAKKALKEKCKAEFK